MIAVVLAGGRGSRLGDIGVPKPLVPVGGVPVIDRILDGLAADGFQEIIVVTGHRADEVERHVNDHDGVGVRFARQAEPLGTADALQAARDLLGEAPFLVTWADVIVEPETYRRVADAAAGHDAGLAVNHVADLSAGGAVAFADGLVTGVTEKPGPGAGWKLTGILALDPAVWAYIDAVEKSVRGEYELPEAIDAWVDDGARIAAVPVDGEVFEIGTPEGLAAASSYFSGETSRSR